MLCENCKKNQANTTIRENINGRVSVHHLCSECAERLGVGFDSFSAGFGDLLGGLFSDFLLPRTAPAVEEKCDLCGQSFDEFARTGRAGCPHCYTTFYDRLLPSLQRLHGNTRHLGKRPALNATAAQPAAAQPTVTAADKKAALQKQLDAAVAAQEFEQAAKLRDEIRAIGEDEQHE